MLEACFFQALARSGLHAKDSKQPAAKPVQSM